MLFILYIYIYMLLYIRCLRIDGKYIVDNIILETWRQFFSSPSFDLPIYHEAYLIRVQFIKSLEMRNLPEIRFHK